MSGGGPGDGMSHAAAYHAVIAGQPGSVKTLADALADNGGQLSAARAALQGSVDTLRGAWQGDTADRFLADIGTLSDYLDHLTTLLHGSGASYAQVLTQASTDLANARKPANLPPPTADAPQAAWDKYLNQQGGNDAMDAKMAAHYSAAQQAWAAAEAADRQQCIQTLNTLNNKYETAAAKMVPPEPAPAVATSGSSGGSSGGASAHSYFGPSGTDTMQQDHLVDSTGTATWVDGNGHTHQGHRPPDYPGYPLQPHPVIGGPTVTTHQPGTVDPQLAGLSTIDGSHSSGGLSSTEVTGLAALGAAGVIGGAAAMMRSRASAASAAAITAAQLEAREQAAERAALARARAAMQSEEQSELTANRSRLLASSEARAEQAAMARGSAGAAGRPMMRPGRGGVIGGKDDKGSERTTWLQEDRGVWGVGEHVAPVVGGEPVGPAGGEDLPIVDEAGDTEPTAPGTEPSARSADRDDD